MKVFIVSQKNIILTGIFFFLFNAIALAQSTNPPAEFNASKGYRSARLAMYNDIDNFNDTMYCFYGNLAHLVPEEGYTTPGHALPFNCEHIVPQSFFDKRAPMVGMRHSSFSTNF